jgi:hypothetical protein
VLKTKEQSKSQIVEASCGNARMEGHILELAVRID